MTVTAMPGRLQAIRLRRPPLLEPTPDEGPAPASVPACTPPAAAALLPLDWPPAAPARSTPTVSRSTGPCPDPAAQAAATARRYVQVCLEVLNGFRPTSHLRTLTGPVEFTAVVGQLARRRNAAGHFPALGNDARALPAGRPPGTLGNAARVLEAGGPPGAPVNAPHPVPASAHRGTRMNAARGAQPYRLQRLLMSEPRPGVAEVVAVLAHAGMSMAVAMRLELQRDRWQCVVVQII